MNFRLTFSVVDRGLLFSFVLCVLWPGPAWAVEPPVAIDRLNLARVFAEAADDPLLPIDLGGFQDPRPQVDHQVESLCLPAPVLDGSSAEQPGLSDRVAELERQLKELADVEKKRRDADVKRPSARLTMQLQADTYFFQQDDESVAAVGDIQDGLVFRRARVGWTGEYGPTEYRIEVDFALDGRPALLDNWIAWRQLPWPGYVKFGHYFEPFSLERVTPNRFTTFLERSLPDQPFAPARNLGLTSYHWRQDLRATWAAGVFRTNSDVFGDDVGDNGERAVTGRATWLPWYDDMNCGRSLLHLGAGYSFRDADNDAVRFRAQPESRTGATTPNVPFFVDTGSIPANSFQLYGLEAAWVQGSFSLQAEYMWVPVSRIDNANPTFEAWYVIGSYFLTGEHRPYKRDSGFFDRVKPFREFFRLSQPDKCSGWGAWEIAARLSHADLEDASVQGGRLTDASLGMNWYMNPWCKIQANWVHPFLDHPIRGNSGCEIFAIRAAYDF